MRPVYRACTALLVLMISAAACVPSAAPIPAANQPAIDEAVHATLTANAFFSAATAVTLPAVATVTQIPGVTETTGVPTSTELPTSTPIPTLTGIVLPTLAPQAPMVSVSVATNCRSGPARSHDWLGGLYPGQSANVLGRYPDLNYWIIQNPNGSGTCWLWGGYATVTGDTAGLPVWPAPTQPAMPALTADFKLRCLTAPNDTYERVGTLDAGESAEIAGRTINSDWWLIVNPDAAGTCWISGRDASITGNLRSLPIVPTPQGVPPATPGPTPTNTPIPDLPDGYRCKIVSSSPQYGDSYLPNADFDGRWKIKNTGTETWEPGDVDYRFLSGAKLYARENVYDLPGTVAPDETIEIIVDMRAPATLGSYNSTWGLTLGSQTFCSLPMTITVKK